MRHSGPLESTFAWLLTALLATMSIPIIAPPAAAIAPATYWVDVVTGSDANPGTAEQPFKTITHALSTAVGLDTVMVRPGTYDETSGETFPLLLSGGESLKSSGGAGGTIIRGSGTSAVLIANSPSDGCTISGLTFTNGGGGFYAVTCSLGDSSNAGWPLIEDNIFRDNTDTRSLVISQWGTSACNPVVRGNQFIDNTADYGAGLWVDMQIGDSTITIEDNLFTGNEGGLGSALGMVTSDTTATITGNTFTQNVATTTGGGAIYLSNTGGNRHTISGNVFLENTAEDGDGGALWLYGATINFHGNDFGGNDSWTGNGGFAYAQYCSIDAVNNGGGGNYAPLEGAVWYVEDCALYLTNETIVDSGDAAHAIYANAGSTLTIDNSILWNPGILDVEGADQVTYSCVSDAAVTGPGVIHDNPGFADPGAHDVRLGGHSPCIDTADPALAPATDYFGTPRPVDGDRNGTALPDMGCHEYVPPLLALEDQAAGVTFDRWVTGFSGSYSGGTYVYGRWTNTELQAKFTGDTIRWIGPKQPSYGMADVYIDGTKVASNVDCYEPSGSATLSATLWESAALSDGPHTIKIRLTGAKNAASSGNVVVIDRFEVEGAAPSGTGMRFNEQGAWATFTGTWVKAVNPTYTSSTYAYSAWAGPVYTASFTGTKVAWIGPKSQPYGKAAVYIDGALKGTIDCYSASTGWRYKIWESGTLSSGPHYIQIKPLHTKSAAATNYVVVVDALDVTP